jgi:hypothetical protein
MVGLFKVKIFQMFFYNKISENELQSNLIKLQLFIQKNPTI